MSNRRHCSIEDKCRCPTEDKDYCPTEDKDYCPIEDKGYHEVSHSHQTNPIQYPSNPERIPDRL
jgi:hypothetical protein